MAFEQIFPQGFPCAYVFALTLSTAYSTSGLACFLTGFLSRGLLLPNLGFFFSAFYSDLWIKMGSSVIDKQCSEIETHLQANPSPSLQLVLDYVGIFLIILLSFSKSTLNRCLLFSPSFCIIRSCLFKSLSPWLRFRVDFLISSWAVGYAKERLIIEKLPAL